MPQFAHSTPTSGEATPRSSVRPGRGAAAVLLAASGLAFGALLIGGTAPAARAAGPTAPPLGTAAGYSVLAGQTVTNSGPTTLSASLGLAPGTAVTGSPTVLAPGTIEIANPAAVQAKADLDNAYTIAAGAPAGTPVGVELGGLNLTPDTYTGGELGLNGTLTLSGGPNDVFVFKAASTLITGPGSNVVLVGGVRACNVFWQVSSSATLATTTSFVGTIMALTDIDMLAGATLQGRALARNGEVRLRSNVIETETDCSPVDEGTETPTSTATGTSTPTATETGTSTPTATATGTSTSTATATTTGTTTATATATGTSTSTATATATGTTVPTTTSSTPTGRTPAGTSTASTSAAASTGGSHSASPRGSGVPVPSGNPHTGAGGTSGNADGLLLLGGLLALLGAAVTGIHTVRRPYAGQHSPR